MKMYKISADQLKDYLKESVTATMKKEEEDVKNKIEQAYDKTNSFFDGEKLKELLFPEIQSSSIFISHSHDDLGKAYSLKQRIEKNHWEHGNKLERLLKRANHRDRQVFIDSYYWNSVDVAKKILVKQKEKEYDPDSVSKHLHIMLITALSKMIEACDLFLFIDGPNSLSENTKTESPWIYYELQIAEMFKEIESKKADELKPIAESYRDRPLMPCFYDVKDIVEKMEAVNLNKLLEIINERSH